MGVPLRDFPHQNPRQHFAFHITGPGRRLGEQGETTAPEPSPPSAEEVERYEEIFNEQQEHFDEEEEEMDEGTEDVYEEATHPSQRPSDTADQLIVSPTSADLLPESTLECEVCYEDLPVSEFPLQKVTAVCQHEARVCYGCLEQDIAIQIGEGVLGQLKCPSCPEKLSFEDIRAYASPDIFRR
jgi:hypothetical protein